MPPEVVEDVQASFARLENGEWGARVKSDRDLTGAYVILTRKNGQEARRRLGLQVKAFTKDDRPITLYTFWKGETIPVTTGVPEELRKQVVEALENEDEDAVYSALMAVASHFNIC